MAHANEVADPDSSLAIAAATLGVFKSFGPVEVLHDVSFSVPIGDSRALVGRNGAGKSTLVAIITGVLSPTSGQVMLAGRSAPSRGDRQAWRERVACVYQRWTIIPTLTVAENLFLNNQPTTPGAFVRWGKLRQRARAVLDEWGLDVDPDLDAWRLSVEQRQIVEIARALLQGSRFIILDEPTAELERREVNRLFDRIKRLQEDGVTFCYISHHLEEIYEVCRTVSVLRDGRLVADAPLAEMPKDRLVEAMVGTPQAATARRNAGASRTGSVRGGSVRGRAPALEVRGLSVEGSVRDVSFGIEAGECVGLAGLASSGKEEIGECIVGLRRPSSGTVRLHGEDLPLGHVTATRRAGVGYLPRDRHLRAILPNLSLAENLTVTVSDTFGRAGLISPARQVQRAGALIRSLGIVASSPLQPITELSGGNQQKGMMGRALASSPKLLVLVSPTQGVDIASKEALFQIVSAAQEDGAAVLVISDELDELAACDRILVAFRGVLTREFGRDWRDHDLVAAIEGLEEADDGS